MKKLTLILTLLISVSSFAQRTACVNQENCKFNHNKFQRALGIKKTVNKFDVFFAPGLMVPTQDKYPGSVSLEAGLWGDASKMSYSAFVSKVPANGETYVGAKVYHTIFDLKIISAMIYVAPQVRVNKDIMFVAEEGAGLNLKLDKNVLFGVYYAQQQFDNVYNMPAISGSIVYLFKK